MKATNKEVLQKLISTNLHLDSERGKVFTITEIHERALNLKNALNALHPVTKKEWEEILEDIATYQDTLTVKEPKRTSPRKARPLSHYERTKSQVYATGNKWAIENFNAVNGR